ncbi:MAG: MFS transporter [Clostridia bacterium]|jgi:DHA3 family macrolide efflux protein-like MFS transporter
MQEWKRKTILFLSSQVVTLFGSSLVQFAIVWYITLKTSSGAWVSALTICSFVPQFIISFFSGVWADRYSKKMLIILADFAIAVSTLVLILLIPHIGNDNAVFIALLAASVIRSLGAGIQTPAVSSMIPSLVPEEYLMKFNGINATVQSVVQFAAPAAAGAILSFSTLPFTLMIDVATAIVGIGILSALTIPKQSRANIDNSESVFKEMIKGMKYAFSDSYLGKLLIIFGIFIFLAVPAGFLAALFVSREYNDSYVYLSIVEIVGFAGMAAGGILIGIWGGFKKNIMTLIVGIIAFGVLGIGMGLINSFIVYLVLMVIYGIALTMVQTSIMTIIQQKSEESMQGKVFGFQNAMYSGCLPIGMVVFGPLADVMPLRLLMIITGILMIIMAVVIRLDKSMVKD